MDSEKEIELEALRKMNRELLDEVEYLYKKIQDIEALVSGQDEWYNEEDFGDEDEHN